MPTTFERTWQMLQNATLFDTSTTINNYKNAIWWFKSFLKGDFAMFDKTASALTTYQGLWTCYYSCDSINAGTPGDGYDRWGVQGSTTANSGSAASLVSGATITGAIRITGVTGLGSSLGNYLTITGAATPANNSPTQTPFKIVKVNSATDVEIWNPLGVTGDLNNGAIVWAERGVYTTPIFGNAATGTLGSAGPIQYSTGAHSWFVLKSPPTLGPYYLIIDLPTGSTGSFYLSFSKTAPTGGTTSARPTAIDEVQLSQWKNSSFINASVTTNILHGGLSTDGYFWLAASSVGAGYTSFTMFQVLTETKTTDAYPALLYHSGNSNLPTIGNINSVSYNGMKSRNGAVTVIAFAISPSCQSNQASLLGSQMTGIDFTDSLYDDLPLYIYAYSSGYKSIRGRIMDIRLAPTGLPNGSVESSVMNPVSTIIGNIWIPCYTTPLI